MKRLTPADIVEREKAIYERERNVIVDAGAGTGKTTLLIARLLHLVAPEDDGVAFPLERIAAITFTRRAAGELKLRLREALLGERARADLSPLRLERLASALAVLDNAMISTVHSFADRLLRLRPADAQISPAYEIAEDPSGLIAETTRWLLDAADHGLGLDAESIETVRTFQAADLRVWSEEMEWTTRLGLDAFIQDLIGTRDREISAPPLREPDMDKMRRGVEELKGIVGKLAFTSPGARRLRQICDGASSLAQTADVAEALRLSVKLSRELGKLRELTFGDDFEGDAAAWAAFKWIHAGERGKSKSKEVRDGGPLGACIIEPLVAWMAERLVRLRPAILARYKALKRASQVLDQIDLLIELRDLLAQNLEVREFYQSLFDHLLVDEFQDTDPLQAEIVMYLCEHGAKARSIDTLELRPAKLTIVGDPKQSIYRFRRADIATYADVCARVRRSKCCEVRLTVNFRSAKSILDWVNDGFDAVLGADTGGDLYNPATGSVCNVRLLASGGEVGPPRVHVLPFGQSKLAAEASRDLEGEALARYLRHLVEDSDVQIADPRTKQLRRPRYGDVAVLTVATQTLHHLTTELDRVSVPHVVRGGTLFMQDELHQQFVLGLRALADPADGAARCALMRPPFFAVGLDDLVRDRCDLGKSSALESAEALIASLRRDRHRGSPGEIARQVLEQTGFGQYVAAGVNGAQRLARLYELCLRLDELARETGEDFDGVTAVARSWIDTPPRIEAPLPVDADAVQVITVHQAKGLEWPIVALWDGRAGWRTYLPQVAFTIDSTAKQWAIKLDGLAHDQSNRKLLEREVALREQERRRVAYVAATRARDLLIVPEAGEPAEKTIAGTLLKATAKREHVRVARYEPEGHGWWESEGGVSMRPVAPVIDAVEGRWRETMDRALQDDLRPAAVTSFTRTRGTDPTEGETEPREPRQGRFGPAFGVAVHRALQLVLERDMSPEAATQTALRECVEALDAASVVQDVERAHRALRSAGLLEQVCRVEYPIAGALDARALLVGSIDLLVVSLEAVSVIDFKTDAPPVGNVQASHASYVAQVKSYGRLLASGAFVGDRELRHGLLFTADGSLHWV